jgi:hypothetical protein
VHCLPEKACISRPFFIQDHRACKAILQARLIFQECLAGAIEVMPLYRLGARRGERRRGIRGYGVLSANRLRILHMREIF